ncbi:MAG TPA: metalloregulator ArsR/SmtB family transcription factor [Clostridia bacterium]|nr:metalloregulator ArsR/SmtB family transcription factor [Clostridia bacterium]
MFQALNEVRREASRWQLPIYFKALSDENRFYIVQRLLEEGELCVCEIMEFLELSQPTISHHLSLLKNAGIIKDRREGKWIYYSLDLANLVHYKELYRIQLQDPLERLLEGKVPHRDHPLCD